MAGPTKWMSGGAFQDHSSERASCNEGGVEAVPDRRGHAPCPAHRRPGRAKADQQRASSPMREEGTMEVSQRVKRFACHSACR